MDLILPLGVDGVALADLLPALYTGGQPDPLRLAMVSMSSLGGGAYLVILPDLIGTLGTFSYVYPPGASSPGGVGSFDYPDLPWPSRVIPLRHAGLTLSDFTLRSFVDGVEETPTWVLTELSTHDYLISGWPSLSLGRRRVITWKALGMESTFDWVEARPSSLVGGARRGMGSWAAGVIKARASRVGTLRRMNDDLSLAVLATGVLAGATVFTVRAITGRMSGRVVGGSQLRIVGVSGVYTVQADSDTQPNGVLAVTIQPGLLGPANSGATVTFSQPYADTPYQFLIRKVGVEDQKAVEMGQEYVILPWDQNKPMPKMNDRFNGIPIVRVQFVDADDGPAYYRCLMDNLTGQGANTL